MRTVDVIVVYDRREYLAVQLEKELIEAIVEKHSVRFVDDFTRAVKTEIVEPPTCKEISWKDFNEGEKIIKDIYYKCQLPEDEYCCFSCSSCSYSEKFTDTCRLLIKDKIML